MELNHIRDVVVLLTTVITVFGIYLKTLNNFFLDFIRSKYENVPGKQPLFDTVFKSIFYIIIALEIPSSIILTATSTKNKISEAFLLDTTFSGVVTALCSLAIAISFCYIIFRIVSIFWNCSIYFTKKLYSKEIKEKNNLNRKNTWVLFISLALTAISIAALLLYFYVSRENQLSKDDINSAITVASIGIVSFTVLILSISFKKVIMLINSKYGYMIITDQDELICRCYLEYKDFYLIIKNNEELYISKSRIKMIKLIKEL